jgi:hypothetical protein
MLSQEQPVGVKCKVTRGSCASQAWQRNDLVEGCS